MKVGPYVHLPYILFFKNYIKDINEKQLIFSRNYKEEERKRERWRAKQAVEKKKKTWAQQLSGGNGEM